MSDLILDRDPEFFKIQARVNKAIEVKTALINMNIDENDYPGLKELAKLLSNWVRDGSFKKGVIKIPELIDQNAPLGRKIEYQLATPDKTVVKFSVIKKYD